MGACTVSALEKRSEIYHFGFLYAAIADLADAKPDYIIRKAHIIESAKKYLNNLEGFYNFSMGKGHSFDLEELDWEFFTINAIRGRVINAHDIPKLKKTLDGALDKITTSPRARKLVSQVFGNLAKGKCAELDKYPLCCDL
ncbi:MAG: hypothetical protein AABW51_01520 [Nanoarchaeota archaeon]